MGAQAMGYQAQADPRSSVPNYGAHEGNEGRCQGHEPGGSRSSTLREHGAEEGCVCAASEECGKVCAPWLVHDQDALEAGDEGWQEGGLWESGHGQSQASKDSGEGLPRLSIEEGFLSNCARCQSNHQYDVRGGNARECSSGLVCGLFVRFVLVHT